MTTTRLLATALPYSLAPDADVHLSVFFTHRLTPTSTPATLTDFPDTANWPSTLAAGTIELVTDTAPDGIATRRTAPDPDHDDWSAVFSSDTPVAGFPSPTVTDQPWVTYPAATMDDHALDLHLASTLVSPLAPPPVSSNPMVDAVLEQMVQFDPGLRDLLALREERGDRYQRILQRRMAEALASLGDRGRRDGGYISEPLQTESAIEVLLRDRDGEQRFTEYLDSLLDEDGIDHPVLAALRDVHAARRFYQREDGPYRDRPDPEAPVPPRPDVPAHDFHERAASLGSTPALTRALGLVVDLLVDDQADRQLLAAANWVSARFTAADGADVIRLSPPRTWCESAGGHWRAVASGAWSGGALPLGDPDRYTVLDLDPDASGLKVEQHVRDLPRMLASEVNGDPASGAPASLRATGFSIAKVDRDTALRAQVERAQTFADTDDDGETPGPDLAYDDVVRGIRLEVWDDVSRAWHSLHDRRVDVTAGDREVLTDVADRGFLQLTGLTGVPDDDTTYYLHQVFAGWDGWSLSAPRPGRIIVHGDGTNGPAGQEFVVDEPPDDPATHVHIRSRVKPGTLPWLRYGRRYAFRVRGVDLAGNSVPRPSVAQTVAGSVEAAGQQLARLGQAYTARTRDGLLGHLRDDILRLLPDDGDDANLHGSRTRRGGRNGVGSAADDADQQAAQLLDVFAAVADQLSAFQERVADEAYLPTAPRVPTMAITGVPDIDALVRDRLATSAMGAAGAADGSHAATPDAGAGLRRGVDAALARLARSQSTWRRRPQLDIDAETFAGLDDTYDPVVRRPDALRQLGPGLPDVEPLAPQVPVVTTPRPFLRWHPVPPPTLVARHELGVGESLQRLVVRDDTASQRHLVPPKGTQLEAEQHGRFDAVIGSSDPDVPDTLLATALKERGTLLDEWIQDLTDPNGRVHQDGIALATRPGADPDAVVTLADIDATRDTPLGEGQYVLHDIDQLTVPYLPDPLAYGVSLVFSDAGPPHTLREPRVLQTVVLPYAGDWPAVEPLRLVVEAGATLGARRDGNQIVVAVPPGEQVRLAISSALDERELAVLGLWSTHVASTTGGGADVDKARALLARAAANGWFWWLTPALDARLVHAVRRPVRPPEIAALRILSRPPGLTVAALAGVVDVHGPSTERLVVEASWSEWVDDVAADAPARVDRHDVVVSAPVEPHERFGLLFLIDAVIDGEGNAPPVVSHRAIQTFADTHHRAVVYTPRGRTRYAEFFDAAELPAPDDPASAGEPVTLTIRSSARPAAPEVVEVAPLLLWESGTEPDQPFAFRRTRRSGARIWLRRPWFSSGDGELLAVVMSPDGSVPPSLSSRWAKDPVFVTGVPAQTTVPPLVLPADLLLAQFADGVVDQRPGRPVTPVVSATLVDASDTPNVQVLGYRPEFHPGRKQWFVDMAMDPGNTLWPFVRLAVARYQPDSVDGADLSPVVLADWVQPLPERTATINRRTHDTVRVTVTGLIGITRLPRRDGDRAPDDAIDRADAILRPSRELFATVQQAPGDGGGDLDWIDHGRVRLPLVGVRELAVTWSAELDLPEPLPVATPGSSTNWRVLVEEIEYFDADPETGPKEGSPSTAQRAVYADHLAL